MPETFEPNAVDEPAVHRTMPSSAQRAAGGSRVLAAASLLVVAIAVLAGCGGQSVYRPHAPYAYVPPAPPPSFWIVYNHPRNTDIWPEGYGWVPGSAVEITLFAQPVMINGELSSANPFVAATVIPDANGHFGDGMGAIPVQRTLCGSPPDWLPWPFLMARDKNGNVRFSPAPRDVWFTFQPCH